MSVRKRALRRFVFGDGPKRKRRGGAQAQKMRNAPQRCKTGLSVCMKGGGRRKASPCMKAFHRCLKGG